MAVQTLKVEPEELEIQVVRMGSPGFLGIGGTPTQIRVKTKKRIDDYPDIVHNKENKPDLEIKTTDLAQDLDIDKDGLVKVEKGEIKVIPPAGTGRYPVIAPGEHMTVRINGIAIQRPTMLTPHDKVEVEFEKSPGERRVEVEITQDKLMATLCVYPPFKIERTLKDSPPTPMLYLETEEHIIPVEPVTLEEARKAIAEAGVVYGLIPEAITRAVEDHSGRSVVIATGTPRIEGSDGRIEFLFERKRDLLSENEGRIDYRELKQIPSVKIGEVVARIIPPVPGTPGMTVTGEEIPVRPVRPAVIIPGEGTRLMGDTIVATTGGRPEIISRTITIVPVLNVSGDVNLETGNIHFNGDVIIHGSVASGMVVEADGILKVSGIVEGAEISARDGVVSLNSIINSTVKAGGASASLSKILPVAKQLLHSLEILADAIQQVYYRLEAKGEKPLPVSQIMHLLIEKKLQEIPRLAKEVLFVSEEKGIDLSEADREVFSEIAALILQPPVDPAAISYDDMVSRISDLKSWIEATERMVKRKANVILKYALNSKIFATGSITVEGQGCFNTILSSGDAVYIKGHPGVFRGGQIVALADVYVNDLGSDTGLTRVSVPENRKVICNCISGSSLIAVGRKSIRIDEPRKATVIMLDEDKNIRIR